ncbi:hypothetical protein D0Y65_043394, partial [Glycine soja]
LKFTFLFFLSTRLFCTQCLLVFLPTQYTHCYQSKSLTHTRARRNVVDSQLRRRKHRALSARWLTSVCPKPARLIDYREGIAAPDTHCPHVLNSSLIPSGNAANFCFPFVIRFL